MPSTTQIDKPGKFKLASIDSSERGGLDKKEGEMRSNKLGSELTELEDLLFEAGQNGLLIVLQGPDTSGKDGAIRHLLRFFNAQSCRVAPFKVPTPLEASHDFLWRIHSQCPAKGETAIFNRSHYEDVVATRVHNLVPEETIEKRYRSINEFERTLAENGTIIAKFFLHISKDEQEKRLLEREKDVEKAWKLSVGDWKEREFWDLTTRAYEDAISLCASKIAPWVIVPADHKWYRNLVITETLVNRLSKFKEPWLDHLRKVGVRVKAEIDAYRAEHPSKP